MNLTKNNDDNHVLINIFDIQFTYKNTIRNILINNFGFFENTFEIPEIARISALIKIRHLEMLDDPKIFNYFYLFKFFFGVKPYYSKIASTFNLGTTRYYFDIKYIFNKEQNYFMLSFLINDILGSTNIRNYKIQEINMYNKYSYNVLSIDFFDMNSFLEKKTNPGLYNLIDFLTFIFFIKCSYDSSLILIDNLKIEL